MIRRITRGVLTVVTMSALVAASGAATADAAAAKTQPATSQQFLHRELNIVRSDMPSLAHRTDSEVIAVLQSHAHTGLAPVGAMRASVSGVGTGTLWFSRSDVAWWATAGTAAVVALCVSLGLWSFEAWPIAGALIGTFWTAWTSGQCAWFTYRKPRSWGTYRC
jgi:hypothetical protein